MKTPVVFLIFNRPQHTREVFARIREARPPQILVVADGPRAAHASDLRLTEEARQVVTEGIDWPCELYCCFAKENLGCRVGISRGLDWAFSLVEEAIVLEDDCVPSPSFFRFCETLLERYRHETKVAHIGGVNVQEGRRRSKASYYFSRYLHCWGWATWRRAWSSFDVNLTQWPALRDNGWLEQICTSREEANYWGGIFEAVYQKEIATSWDYQWVFTCWLHRWLGITPEKNLVTNIGIGPDATHTKEASSGLQEPAHELGDLRHADAIDVQKKADEFTYLHHYGGHARRPASLARRTRRKLGKLRRRVLPTP